MNKKHLVIGAGLFFLMGACASSGGLRKVNRHVETIGEASTYNFHTYTDRLLGRYSYTVNRFEQYSSRVYYETMWKDESLLEDELEMGITAIQTRLILEARPKMKEPMAGREENSIKLTGEVLVRTDPMGDWLDLAMTSMRKDYFKRIADDYKFDLRGALRRF
jgi:hypothetical protein